MSRRSIRRRSNAQRSIAVSEALEGRRLFSIVWTNRGGDNFAALSTFGASAAAARNVVDQAIADWNAIILNFNHAGGGNTYNLMFTVADLGNTLRARGNATSHDGERVPNAGSITLDDNAGGPGWYVDPTPADDAEFDTVNGPWSASGSVTGNDLYRTAAHEIGHCVGIVGTGSGLLIDDFLTDLGVDDPNTTDAGNLWAYNFLGGASEATFTEADTGHIYEGPAINGRPDIPFHPLQLMNPGRAAGNNERKIISDIESTILQQVYGYTIAQPSQVNNMLVNPNFTSGELTIRGMPGNVNDVIVVQGTANAGELHVTVGSFIEVVPLGQISTVVAHGGDGSDLFRLEYNANRFTTFNGGNGTDTVDLAFVTRNLSNIGGPTKFNGGPGADFMHLYDNNYTPADAFSVDEDSLTRFGTGIQQYDAGVENVFLTTGTNHNTVNIPRTSASTKLYLNSSGGQDLVNIGLTAAGTANILGDIEIQNDPNFTTINIDDTGRNVSRFPLVELSGQFGWVSRFAGADFTTGPTIYWDNADVQEVRITTGAGNDGVEVRQCSERLFIDNSGGRDNVTIGNGPLGMQQITGQIDVEPTPSGVFTDLIFDDTADTVARSITWSSVGFDMLVNGMAPVPIRYDEHAIDTFTLLGGSGSDTFVLTGDASSTYTVTVNGGGGTSDSLQVDDRNFQAGDLNFAWVYENGIARFWDWVPQITVGFDNCEQMIWSLPANDVTEVNVQQISSDFTTDFQIRGSIGTERVLVHPSLQNGGTINGNLWLIGNGGADLLSVVDDAISPGGTYTLSSPFGTAWAYLTGIGNGYVSANSDIESVVLQGGNGNDTFRVDQFKSGQALSIYGGGGNDNCTIGNGDMSANLTSASGFTFDGQGGSDHFTIANDLTSTAWGYSVQDGFVDVTRSSNGYFWHSVTTSIEGQYLLAGSSGDYFYVDAIAPGVYTELRGTASTKRLLMGNTTSTLQPIQGKVAFFPGPGGGFMNIYNNADSTADIVHQTASSLGAYPGDTLFGPGGSLGFNNVVNSGSNPGIKLFLSSGANTAYVQPLATALVSINSHSIAFPPSGSIKLALAGVTNPVISGSADSGSLTSSNRQTLSWTKFAGAINTDAIAPAVANMNFKLNNGAPSIAPQSMRVTFTEAIGSAITPDFLSLFNVTTGTQVPSANIAVAYDAPTLTATFTFPGYPVGVLPNGTYQAQILTGLGDAFGNAMPASAVQTFIWAAGTSGSDTFRVKRAANFSDINVFLNNDTTPMFVSGPTTAQVVLSGDAGNDLFIIDLTNLDPTPATGGISIDGNEGANTVLVKGGPNVEGVTFFPNYIGPGANFVDLVNVQARQFDGGGGYDALGVYTTTVILPTSQRFGSLGIDQAGTVIVQPGLNGLLITKSLSILANSTLDLNDSDMIVDYTGASQLANVVAAIKTGRNSGAWNGSGITSTAARNNAQHNTTLGALEATDFKSVYGVSAPFDGEPIDNTSVLVKYTYYGDTDFNGKVDGADYARIDAKFNQQVVNGNIGGWFNGDADYNGKVDGADYALIDAAFNSQGSAVRSGGTGSSAATKVNVGIGGTSIR